MVVGAKEEAGKGAVTVAEATAVAATVAVMGNLVMW